MQNQFSFSVQAISSVTQQKSIFVYKAFAVS